MTLIRVKAIEDSNRAKLTNEWFNRWGKIGFPTKAEDWNTIDLKDLSLAASEFDDKNWETIKLLGRIDFPNEQDLNGAFWLRRTVSINDINTDYTFISGPIDDTDVVFINGEKIGGKVNSYSEDRKYNIPRKLLKKGVNSIAIRIIDTGGPGSINGDMKIVSENQEIFIEGDWKYIISAEIYQDNIYIYNAEKVKKMKRPGIIFKNSWPPSALYNAMIHPLLPFNIKGVIWYQGESNVGRVKQYQEPFPAMIQDWRKQ